MVRRVSWAEARLTPSRQCVNQAKRAISPVRASFGWHRTRGDRSRVTSSCLPIHFHLFRQPLQTHASILLTRLNLRPAVERAVLQELGRC